MRYRIKKLIVIVVTIYLIAGLITALIAKSAFSKFNLAVKAFQSQDLDATKKHLKDAKRRLQTTKTVSLVFTPVRIIPVIGWYVADLQRGLDAAVTSSDAAIILTEAITPYADVLGLKGDGNFQGGTAQERLAKSVETLAKISPQIDEVGKKFTKARQEVDKISSWRYPNILPGRPGRKIDSAKKLLGEVETLLVDAKPLLLALPEIMGQFEEKKYLVLFQNDKELRPTGGFITAYAVFRVNKGAIESEGSQDSYELDQTLLKKVPAPAPIVKYLPNVPNLNLRDSNLSPDYLASMKQFEQLYEFTQAKKDIDGIIALDTGFVVAMMNVLGPIEVLDSKYTTDKVKECDCPQIIYELEKAADEPVAFEKSGRKGIIGVLMQQMMAKAFAAPKSAWPDLIGTTLDALRQKHMLLYFHNPQAQEAIESLNFAGRVNQYDDDYFYINEANFAGAKSNLFVTEKVKQTVKKGKDNTLEKKVTIEYKYPRKMDNCNLERQGGLCLAGIYRDYIRIYVPKGSVLTKSSGVTMTTTEDLTKTVFEGFFELRPEGSLKIELDYTVPVKVDKEYKLLIQKQPGTEGHTYELDAFGKKQKSFPLTTDKEIIVKI